jgi:hypothetical protein
MKKTETIACVTWESCLEAIERMADTAYDNPGQFCVLDVHRLRNVAKAIESALERDFVEKKYAPPANQFDISEAERESIMKQILGRSTPWPTPPPHILITTPTNGTESDDFPKLPVGESFFPKDLIDGLRPENILKNLNDLNQGYKNEKPA